MVWRGFGECFQIKYQLIKFDSNNDKSIFENIFMKNNQKIKTLSDIDKQLPKLK